MRFLRSRKLRNLLYQSASGKCQLCGHVLPDDWHADHVVPYCVSGETNVFEMQALCPACNLSKGSKMGIGGFQGLRMHQRRVRKIAEGIGPGEGVLAWVCPGGGKSRLPGYMLEAFSKGGRGNVRVAWFVPRVSLRRQAQKGMADDFGMSIKSVDEARASAVAHDEYKGFVATQACLVQNIEMFAHEFRRRDYLLVVDELHHAKIFQNGERNALARALEQIEPYCKFRLYMTGTLATNDNSLIHGIQYVRADGQYVPDFDNSQDHRVRYDRVTGMQEGAITTAKFHQFDGVVSWRKMESGGQDQCRLSEAQGKQRSEAVTTFVSTEMANEVLDACVKHFVQCGTKMIAIADSQADARAMFSRLKGEHKCYLAISDNDTAKAEVEAFQDTKGEKSILVTCQMAYEGLDVPEASHLAYLTCIRSRPWVEQSFGRVWRSQLGKRGCHIFCPDDSKLNEIIDSIRKEDMIAVRIMLEREREQRESPERDDFDTIIPIHGYTDSVSVRGLDTEEAMSQAQEELVRWAESHGLNPNDPDVTRLFNKVSPPQIDPPKQEATESPAFACLDDEEKFLRKDISRKCRYADARAAEIEGGKVTYGRHSTMLARRMRKGVKDMSISELRKAHAIAKAYATR